MSKKILIIISAILLLCCCLDLHLNYSFYQVLRWVVAITGIIFAFENYQKCQWKFIVCCIIAVLFNPIAPIFLSKQIWIPIDIITAVTFLNVAFLRNT